MSIGAVLLRALMVAVVVAAWLVTIAFSGSPAMASLGWAAVCALAAVVSSTTAARVVWFNVGAVVVLVGLFAGYFESSSDQKLQQREQIAGQDADVQSADDDRFTSRGVYHYDGELVYDVGYTSDRYGMRVGPPVGDAPSSRCVLIFGCSFVFGVGVDDRDTIGHRVEVESGGDYRSLNFGSPGTGPHHMLDAIESGFVQSVADCEPEHAVYIAIADHINRAAGNLMAAGDPYGPKFVVDADGSVVRRGNHNRFYSLWPESAVLWRIRSELHGLLRGDAGGDRDLALFVAIVDESRRRLQQRFPGLRFHVVYWDGQRQQLLGQTIEAAASRRGLDVVRVSEVLPVRDDWSGVYEIRNDGHPTAAANALLAEHLVRNAFVDRGDD